LIPGEPTPPLPEMPDMPAPAPAPPAMETPAPAPAAYPDTEADFRARFRRRMQSRTNEGPADYNDPRMSSVKTLREREEDFPAPELPVIERERYSASGFSGRTEQQEREGTWEN